MKKILLTILLLLSFVFPQYEHATDVLIQGNLSVPNDYTDLDSLSARTVKLDVGTNVNEFSIDGTLAGDSDDVIPTEKAIKTYVDAQGGFADPMSTRGDIIYRNPSNLTARLGLGSNKYVLQSNGTDLAWSEFLASEMNIVDAGVKITATEVEGALQENRIAIDLNTLKETNTDDQVIDVYSISGNNVQLSLEDDGEATKTVDISSTTAVSANTAKVTMTYPGVGIALSTGSAWGTSVTNNSANWNTAYTDRLKWDGGATGLVASTGRTSLGGTTIGQNIFIKTNPSAITFGRANTNNTFDWLSASDFRIAIDVDVSGTDNSTDQISSTLPIVTGGGSPTVDQLQEYIDNTGSSGFFLGGELTDGGAGTLNVAAGSGFIRTTNDENAELQSFKWSASSTIAVADNTTQYVYVDDSGVITLSTNEFLETPDKIQIGIVTDEGGSIIHVFSLGVRLQESIGAAGRFMRHVHGIERNNRLGGLIFGQSGDANRDVTMTAGELEWGRTTYVITTFNTSGADTYFTYSASGQEDAVASQWPNEQYDNAGTLTTMGNNKWANLFFWVEPDDHIIMVYGRAQFSTEGQADNEDTPSSSLPSRVSETGFLVARFTFQKSANTATISSAFEHLFANAAVTGHNDLSTLAWTSAGHTGTASTFAGFDGAGVAVEYTEANYILAAGTRAFSGNQAFGGFNLTNIGSLGETGARIVKGWFADLEVTNDITIGGSGLASIYQSLDGALTSISALPFISASFIKLTADDTYAVRTITETKTDLSLENVDNVGTDDTAYNATSWDSNLEAATKNAIRDKIETLGGGHNAVTLNANATAAGLSLATQEINYRASDNTQSGYATAAQVTSQEANATHAADNTQAHSDYLINNGNDSTSGELTAADFIVTNDNNTNDSEYVPMILHGTDATPPTASGFVRGTLYIQYTP